MSMDAVFRALADPVRRRLLDRLHARNGQTLSELCEGLDMTRQAVTKHLAVLEAANLVASQKHGREKLHFINPVPINDIAERWIGKFDAPRLAALAELKRKLEEGKGRAMTDGISRFVYVTYIRTTPEDLWAALTKPEFIKQYWLGVTFETDWKVGSPWKMFYTDGQRHRRGRSGRMPIRLAVWPCAGGISGGPRPAAEGEAFCVMDIEPVEGAVKLTIDHSIAAAQLEADRGGLRRLATHPVQPQVAARDRSGHSDADLARQADRRNADASDHLAVEPCVAQAPATLLVGRRASSPPAAPLFAVSPAPIAEIAAIESRA